MKTNIDKFAILIVAAVCTQTAFADIKVKSKQTISGQSYESTTYIKGKRQRSESTGGMINIMQCDLRRAIQLNTNSKTYMVNPFSQTTQTVTEQAAASTDKNGVVQAGGKVTTTMTIKDTGERKQMFGYTARHLIITMETVSSPDACNKNNTRMQTDGWYIDAAFALDCDYGFSGGQAYGGGKASGCRDKYEMKSIGTAKRGYPVYEKVTMFDENGRETFSMLSEVTELSKAVLDMALFDIPEGYREVSDAAQMYAAASAAKPDIGAPSNSIVANKIRNADNSAVVGAKKQGIIRIGLSAVKTGAVGEGISAGDLSAAVQNTLIQYLKTPNIEVITLEARLASAIDAEALQKECDYVILATATHKKGGGGFGMFKSIAPVIGSVVPMAGGAAGGVAGHVAGTVASHAIITAAEVSGNIKSKDEITLDLKLNKPGGATAFAKVYKAKAKSDGEDIISQIIEQAAQAVVDTVGKS